MTRADQSFGQMVTYASRDASDPDYTIRRNLYGHAPFEVVADFEDNARYLRKRKNGTTMHHVIVSIVRAPGVPEQHQKTALRDIVDRYIGVRAPDNLAYAVLHDDRAGNYHYHVILSSNALQSKERLRYSKADFRAMNVEIERWALARYPELQQSITIGKRAERKLSQPGGELKRRTGETPKRESVVDRARAIFNTAADRAECMARMKAAGIDLYRRGNTVGVIDTVTGRKHRLKTLGLMPEFLALSARIQAAETRAAQIAVEQNIAAAQQRQNAVPASPAEQSRQPAKVQSMASNQPKEADVNIIDLALQGVAAVADALSITPNSMQQPSNDPTDRTDAKAGDPAQDERERIARERQAELEALAVDNSRSATLKR